MENKTYEGRFEDRKGSRRGFLGGLALACMAGAAGCSNPKNGSLSPEVEYSKPEVEQSANYDALKEKIESVPYGEARLKIMRDAIYNDPKSAEMFLERESGVSLDKDKWYFSHEDYVENSKDFWERGGVPFDKFGEDPRKDRLAIAVYVSFLRSF